MIYHSYIWISQKDTLRQQNGPKLKPICSWFVGINANGVTGQGGYMFIIYVMIDMGAMKNPTTLLSFVHIITNLNIIMSIWQERIGNVLRL